MYDYVFNEEEMKKKEEKNKKKKMRREKALPFFDCQARTGCGF